MMRRSRWLAVGAVLGAVGYQRLHRATRSLASQSDQVPAVRQAARVLRRAAGRRLAGGVVGFISDVRGGMDDYLDRHQANMNRQYRHSGNTLVTQRTPDRAAIPGGSQKRRQD